MHTYFYTWQLSCVKLVSFVNEKILVRKISINLETDLQDKNLSSRAVDVELAVRRIIGVDTLPSQEVDDVLRSIFIPVGRGDLRFEY